MPSDSGLTLTSLPFTSISKFFTCPLGKGLGPFPFLFGYRIGVGFGFLALTGDPRMGTLFFRVVIIWKALRREDAAGKRFAGGSGGS